MSLEKLGQLNMPGNFLFKLAKSQFFCILLEGNRTRARASLRSQEKRIRFDKIVLARILIPKRSKII